MSPLKKISKMLFASAVAMFFVASSVCADPVQKPKADLVIFSYDRPIQLYALLESIDKYITGLEEVHVIYRASNDAYAAGYNGVFKDFACAIAHKQGDNPAQDFKPLTLQAAFDSPCDYILFAVDDIIVKDFIDVDRCIQLLEDYGAYGFYFRLGLNLSYCYTVNRAQQLPQLNEAEEDVFAWRFNQAAMDWGYPNTVDMTLYRKQDIKKDLCSMHYHNPNRLEGDWARRVSNNKKGLCFATTKIVNLPLNRVQETFRNRHMNLLAAQELLDIFNQGLKIDINTLFQIDNKSAHMEYEPRFIER